MKYQFEAIPLISFISALNAIRERGVHLWQQEKYYFLQLAKNANKIMNIIILFTVDKVSRCLSILKWIKQAKKNSDV